MDHIKDELSHLGGMSSNDAFDLLTPRPVPRRGTGGGSTGRGGHRPARQPPHRYGQPGLLPLGRGGRPGRGRPPPE
ncbi:MAG: hypothetical protein ACLUNZ_09960 [Evtepia sp.]